MLWWAVWALMPGPSIHAAPLVSDTTPADAAPAASAAPVLDLYLSVTLNGNPVEQILPFIYQKGSLWAQPSVLHTLGFKDQEGKVELVRLAALSGVSAQYDEALQALDIQAPLALLDLTATVISTGSDETVTLSDSRGVVLNYDLYANRQSDGASTLSAANEFRLFSNYGVFSNTMFAQAVNGELTDTTELGDQGWHSRNVRLDTSWRTSWAQQAVTLTLGDTFTGGLSWSRSARIGGIRLGRNFSLQPYRTITPLPVFMGSAVTPSAVDLYIDGIKRYDGRVPAGPFQLNASPSITGYGNALIVLTDAAGRQTQLSIPFYSASSLLEEGVADWSVETGYIREDYGINSFRYASEPVVGATLRYGLSKALTVETHVESSKEVTAGGVGAVAALASMGEVSAAYATSTGSGAQGRQYSLGYQWVGHHFNIGAHTTRTSGRYRDVAASYGAAPPEVSENLVVGSNFDQMGTISASYIRQRYPGEKENRYAGVYWSKLLGERAMLSFSFNQNLNDRADRQFYLGLSISLGERTNASASIDRSANQNSYTVAANQTTSGNTGWGWSLRGRQAEASSGSAQLDYRGRYGDYWAGANAYSGGSSAYAGTSGSLVAVEGRVFAGRRITDSFAVVSTDGVPDVPVKLHNSVVGKTDDQGYLLIEPLMAYQNNLVSIDPLNLPVNMKIDKVAVDVATHERAGAVVKFGIKPVRAASILLHDRNNQPVPLGAQLVLNGESVGYLVGYDGVAYVEGLQARNRLEVNAPGFLCAVDFDYLDPGDAVIQIGPLRCE